MTKAVLPQLWMQSDWPFHSGHTEPAVLFGHYRKSFKSTRKKPPPSPCPGSHNVRQGPAPWVQAEVGNGWEPRKAPAPSPSPLSFGLCTQNRLYLIPLLQVSFGFNPCAGPSAGPTLLPLNTILFYSAQMYSS